MAYSPKKRAALRAVRAHKRVTKLEAELEAARLERGEAFGEALDEGWSLRGLGEVVDLSGERVRTAAARRAP
ncbi:MAG: hypothetical protein ACF8PN_05080 [Phycisphaerales bacterium]